MNNSYDFNELEHKLKDNSESTEQALAEFFESKSEKGSLEVIKKAQCYSLLGGGKRIRPFLVNEVCRMLGGSIKASMPFAIAVEMIHTYSLIHDDLPCMDDDDMRRGKPTNHKVFGEAEAVLAGDALLTNAFLAAASNKALEPKAVAEAVAMISEAAGDAGMIGGQIIDIKGEGKTLTLDELLVLHSLKTGKMIELSAALGCLAAGYDRESEEFENVTAYARGIGLAFQIVDDILDVVGDESTVGKTLASDEENQKTTFLTFYNIEEARAYAKRVSEEAIAKIEDMENSQTLSELAVFLLNRIK